MHPMTQPLGAVYGLGDIDRADMAPPCPLCGRRQGRCLCMAEERYLAGLRQEVAGALAEALLSTPCFVTDSFAR